MIGHHDINDVALISEDVGSVIFNFRLVMYSGSKSRGRVGFGVCFSGSGRVRGSTFRGRPPRVFGVSGFRGFLR